MARYVIRRFLMALPALFGLIILTFVLSRVIPGDPAATLAGDAATPAMIAEIRAQYGLDRPIIEQAFIHVRQVLTGDFGKSIFSGRPVAEEVMQRLPATLELTFAALFIAVLLLSIAQNSANLSIKEVVDIVVESPVNDLRPHAAQT